ncbi:hypothetical protein V2J09_014536 [Rumex salicifolius]
MPLYLRLAVFLAAAFFLVRVLRASEGDEDPLYKSCFENCETTGCVDGQCFQSCNLTSDGNQWYLQEPLYVKWKQWDCRSDCRYRCVLSREEERKARGEKPVKYHGKWPFQRVQGIQEPVSVALSALNLAVQFHGWISFFILVYYKLPLKSQKPWYEYTGLWHIYGILAMNSWFWNSVFHSRDVELTEKFAYSSAVALLGFSLVLAILRTFSIRDEAARVMVIAPLIAFVTTHIMYLNFYKLDYGLYRKVCFVLMVSKLALWVIWATLTRHPSRWKVWAVMTGAALSLLLLAYDFPPYRGFIDSHALWHASIIPLSLLWWSFVRDDAEFRTK